MKTFEFTQDQIRLLLTSMEAMREEYSKVLRNPYIDTSSKELVRNDIVCLKTLYNYLDS